MPDEALAVFIPIHGDKIAVRRFSVKHLGASTKGPSKNSLFETLKKRMAIGGSDDETNNPGTSTAKWKRGNWKYNKWAEKATRKVEVGWIHEGKQVRTHKGGGTRALDVPKQLNKISCLSKKSPEKLSSSFSFWKRFIHSVLSMMSPQKCPRAFDPLVVITRFRYETVPDVAMIRCVSQEPLHFCHCDIFCSQVCSNSGQSPLPPLNFLYKITSNDFGIAIC